MASELWVNDAGTARQIREVWVNDAGVARRIQEIWVNDSGTARCIFRGDLISISDRTANSTIDNPSVATYGLTSAGDIIATQGTNSVNDVGDWITPKTNMSLYECRATSVIGTPTTGTMGAWQSLSSTRSWTLVRTTSGLITSVIFTLEIRRASDGVVMDTATITLECVVP